MLGGRSGGGFLVKSAGLDLTSGGTITGNLVVTGSASVGTTLGVTGTTTTAGINTTGTIAITGGLTTTTGVTLNSVSGSTTISGATIVNSGARITPTLKTGSYLVAATDGYLSFKGTSLTATLPAAPSSGACHWIKNKDTGTLTVARNGKNIDGAGSDLTVAAGGSVFLVYDSTDGWSTFKGA